MTGARDEKPMFDERAASDYDQGTDLDLLTKLFGFLETRSVIDVGAERGTFVRVLLNAGAEAVYAFEPFPGSVAVLKSAFAETTAVTIFDVAVGDRDGEVTLYVVEDKTALHEDAFHSLVPFDETPSLRRVGEIPVRCRTLASLVDEGLIPAEVGILKVDAERSDFAVLRGMGRLSCHVVMIEYWNDLEATVGPAAYEIDDVAAFMADRGYGNYVVVKRHGEFETLQVNDGTTRPGDWGNVVFIHDAVFHRLAAAVFAEAAAGQQRLIDKAQFFADEAAKRLAVIERDEAAAATAHDAQQQLTRQLQEKEALIGQLVDAAQERLELAEDASAQAAQARAAHQQLSEQLLDRERRLADVRSAAEERLRLLEASTAEVVEARAEIARLNADLAERARVIDELATAAGERLRLLEAATAECDRLRQTIARYPSDIDAVLEDLGRKDQLIDELTTTAEERLRLLEGATAESDQLRLIVAGHPDEVAELFDDIERKERLIAELSATADERLDLIRRLAAEASAAHDLAQQLAEEVTTREQAIERLTEELENKERVIVDLADTAEQRLRLLKQAVPNPTGSHQR